MVGYLQKKVLVRMMSLRRPYLANELSVDEKDHVSRCLFPLVVPPPIASRSTNSWPMKKIAWANIFSVPPPRTTLADYLLVDEEDCVSQSLQQSLIQRTPRPTHTQLKKMAAFSYRLGSVPTSWLYLVKEVGYILTPPPWVSLRSSQLTPSRSKHGYVSIS